MSRLPLTLLLLPILAFSAVAVAAPGGSWSRQVAGGVLANGNQLLVGRALHAPSNIPPSAASTQIAWKITSLLPPPLGLEIKLCRYDRCLSLPALSGQIVTKRYMPASGDYRFIYSVKYSGKLIPQLTIVNSQLTINYH